MKKKTGLDMKTLDVNQADSKSLMDSINDFVYRLNDSTEEEAVEELEVCDLKVLDWLLNEIAIPNGCFTIAQMLQDIIKKRKENPENLLP